MSENLSNSNNEERQHDVIVVGAGIVGTAIGHALGRQGRRVLVLERDLTEPDRIVGELLQPGGVLKLKELGLSDCLEEIDSIDVHGYVVYENGKPIHLPYPVNSENGKIINGRSFHHGRFIMRLRDSCKNVSGVEMEQGTVTGLLEDGARVNGVIYKSADGSVKEAQAPLTIVCDGCFSNLRKGFMDDKPSATSSFIGLILENMTLPTPKHGHVFLTHTGPVLCYQIGTNETRMLVDISHPLPSSNNGELQKYLLNVTAPQLPENVRIALEQALKKGDGLRSMRNAKLHPHHCLRDGVLLLGDSFNMRHPLTGAGMTVGFSDAALVAKLLKPLSDFSDQRKVVNILQPFYQHRKGYASTLNILAGALYNVFAPSGDPNLPDMREACMSYFKLGGIAATGPISLLAGLNKSPVVLVLHFFAVAVLGVMKMIYPFPSPSRIMRAYRLLSAAANVVVPLIHGEKVTPYVPVICKLLCLTKQIQQSSLNTTSTTNSSVQPTTATS
eukprot:TRINITY_DN2515_c0_g1_i1.p1 TRINITY_DN2515_c0_g1~~TRINITY_DN2515_c0_g1_i1.p1  ORF type:complete len:501 (-),score=131.13 TRINITY_DN2515_c0_g1_i1:75-1577(-)